MKYAAIAATLLMAAACSPAPPEQAPVPDVPPAATTPSAANALTDFVEKVSLSNMFEIEASKIAIERATTPAVKTFARQMVTDHTATSTQLKGILAAQSGSPVPPVALDQAHLDKLTALRNVEAAKFDELYLDQQTEAHENAHNLLESYASSGDNPDVRAFAATTAPKVKTHLEHVKTLDDSDVDEPKKS